MDFGYPAASPFAGQYLHLNAASHARDDGNFSPNPIGIGTDMTGGCSGGPWIYKFDQYAGAYNYVNGATRLSCRALGFLHRHGAGAGGRRRHAVAAPADDGGLRCHQPAAVAHHRAAELIFLILISSFTPIQEQYIRDQEIDPALFTPTDQMRQWAHPLPPTFPLDPAKTLGL